MDELLTLGCIALFFALVVVPILAIIALSRSTAVRSELATLRRRVEVLEQRGVTEAPATVVTTVPQSVSQMVVPVETSSPAVNIVLSEPVADVTPESVDPWRPQPKPQNEALPTPAVEQSSAFGGVMSSLVRWFMQGNPLAKLGILLLFLGFSFLLRYTVEHSLFPLELRLVATSLFAIALLLALRRYPSLGRPLVLAALALGGAFTTLAIPLALSARWTAMAWALEGLGILWLGVQQQQRRMSYSGTALLVLAVCSALWAQMNGMSALSLVLIFAVLSLSWLAAAWLWRNIQLQGSWVLLAGGLIFWIIALIGASQLVLKKDSLVLSGVLALMAISVWGWRIVSGRLAWWELDVSKWLLWPTMLVMLLSQISQHEIFAAGWQNLAWCLALPAAGALLWRDAETLPPRLSRLAHLSLFWMILLALAAELFWFAQDLPWGMAAWGSGLMMAAGGLLIFLVHEAVHRQLWPFRSWPALYASQAMIPVAAVLVVLLVLTNLQDGVVYRQTWLPLVNPLEEGAAFALLGLIVFYRVSQRFFPVQISVCRPWPLIALLALSFWWLNGILLRALAWYGEVPWSAETLWHSRLIQTCFALFWMLAALVVMLRATRRCSRREWLCGSVLLGIVIVKLMLVDSARGGGLARAVTFIGVAILVLIVGYFSPLPPKAGEEK
ncbi:TPA: DUF2339 domain-containing protein [Escherichia coli]|nr:DUF2339 domain-containing protein [Escherichia coli]